VDRYVAGVYRSHLTRAGELGAGGASRWTAVAVWTYLHTYPRRSCWPGQARIARELGISTKTARRALGYLVDAGWIVVGQRRTRGGRVGLDYRTPGPDGPDRLGALAFLTLPADASTLEIRARLRERLDAPSCTELQARSLDVLARVLGVET